MSKLELVTSDICPFAQRTRIALIEKGLEYDSLEIEFLGDSFDKPDWFLELTPTAQMPVLKYAGDVIYESDIVNEYIDEVFPEPALMPKDPARRAFARNWIAYSNSKFLQGFYGVIMSLETERQEFYKAEFADRLRYMEREGLEKLSDGGPYWLGEQMTLADLSFYPFIERFGVLEHYRGFSMPDDCVRLKAWLAAMRDRPSVAATLESDEYHIDVYKNYAVGKQIGNTAKEWQKVIA
jgi:glutathione S-transferase